MSNNLDEYDDEEEYMGKGTNFKEVTHENLELRKSYQFRALMRKNTSLQVKKLFNFNIIK